MSKKSYPGTFEFVTSKDPVLSFDRVKAMAAILDQEIKLVYQPPAEIQIDVNAQSTKEAFKGVFAAAMSKKLRFAEDALVYKPDDDAYPDDRAGQNRLERHVQEIANKTGVAVGYHDTYGGRGSVKPERKNPASFAQQRRQP